MTKVTAKDKILIYGYGVEGRSSEKFFQAQGGTPTLYDEHQEAHNTKPDFADFDLIVVSAGINRETKIPQEHWEKCTSNTELFFKNLSPENQKKIIGITGTKGKSSTAKLIHETFLEAGLKSALAGNFGTGLLDFLETIEDLDFLVVELSSYQLAYLRTSPPIALCTNLYEDHLSWHGSRESYHQAKSHLWAYQQKGDLFFIPEHQADHPLFNRITEQPNNRTMIVCPPASASYFDPDSIWQASHYLENFGLAESLMKELENRYSACPVFSGVTQLLSSFKAVCRNFQPLPHRLQHVGTFQEIDFYDDAISTNPESTIAAIRFLGKKCGTLLLGGQDRDQDWLYLIEALEVINPLLHIIILPSETADPIEQILTQEGSLAFSRASSMKAAVKEAFRVTDSGKICLLSPAAPSFDHYQNYMEKGKDFAQHIQQWANAQ